MPLMKLPPALFHTGAYSIPVLAFGNSLLMLALVLAGVYESS